jgi:hypothetical protein
MPSHLEHRRDPPSMEALLYQAQQQGILPITSQCGSECVFCSNRYNPPSCEIFNIPPRSLDDIRSTLSYLQGAPGPIVIGESVTRINEGEPLTHPNFIEIVRMVRQKYPRKTIRVTTNAMLLGPALVDELKDLGVDLIVSLNTVGKRKEVMGDGDPQKTLKNVRYLGGRITFEGSVVALPFITGWDDLEETLGFMKDAGASSIRLLAPGFSSRHPLSKNISPSTCSRLREFAEIQGKKLDIPVLFEPPDLRDLEARVEAVIPDSPADRAGLLRNDVIRKVSGRGVFSRKDCFQSVRFRENPVIAVERDGGLMDFRLVKPRLASPGFVMYEDLSREEWVSWERQAGFNRGRPLILTSVLAKPLIEAVLEMRGLEATVVAVKNRFFGGNIQAAGLLTVRDLLAAYAKATRGRERPSTVTLPARAFDPWGRDLEGVTYEAFVEKAGVPVIFGG